MRLLLAAAAVIAGCVGATVVSTPTPAPSPLTVAELKYRVFEKLGRPWYCDSDFYPIARANELDLARQRLPEVRQDAEVFATIVAHDSLPADPGTWTDSQLLTAYHDWKDLRALALNPTGPAGSYGTTFVVRPADGTRQTTRLEIRVDTTGKVDVLSREAAGPPNCPICLADTTAIDTPSGPVRVTDLRVGDVVWTAGANGARIAAPLLTVATVDAPAGHVVLRVTLADGRSVTASPGHPTARGRTLGSLEVGEALDGSTIVSIERLPYRGRTYDVLPAGPTGAYWADGVLLGSTLRVAR